MTKLSQAQRLIINFKFKIFQTKMEEKTAQKAGTASVRNFPSTNVETYKRAKSVKSEHPIEFRKDKKKYCFPVY